MPEESKDLSLLEAIRELKKREPFHAFTILLSSGDRYLIENGDNLVELKSEFFYAFPGGEKMVFIRMNQIAAVEELGPATRGRRRR
jgi:hypothetical protein